VSDDLLGRLVAEIRAEGGLLAGALRDGDAADDLCAAGAELGAVAASGPRAQGARDELALVVEAIREGYLLHFGESRLFATADRDLALLAGDRLYALGLARLAALGDLDAVAELADVIALGAQSQAEGRPDVAEAVWEAGAAAVGFGATPALAAAKDAARAGEGGAAAALRAAARQARGDVAPVR
jgi:hypothetical protein